MANILYRQSTTATIPGSISAKGSPLSNLELDGNFRSLNDGKPDNNGTGATGTWSISISGNAGTVTNGVYTNGSYADPAWITSLAKSKVGLANVENTALSTWAGSTNITTIGAATATSLSVTGNLTVNGTTTTVNSTTVTIDDPIFTLGGDTAPASDDNKDRGIEFRWHNGTAARVGFFGYDDSTGKFTFIPDATNTSEVFSGTKGTVDANLEWADVLSKPNYVASVATTAPLSGGAAGSVGGTLTLSLASAYGDTQNPYGNKTANQFLAAPNGSTGLPTFRTIVAADIPTLNQNTTGTASNVTGTVAIANGGTGATTNTAARTNLGATTIGSNLFTLTNPSAITFLRVNADNTVSALDAATFRTAIGAGTSSTVGTVTSVGGTGTVSGLTLSGTVTSSGNLTLGGTLSVAGSNFGSQTANQVLAAPNGSAGNPTFRALVAADIPTLNQNTTGSAGSVANSVTFNNAGSGAASGTTFNGSGAVTISHNTIGAAALASSNSFTAANTFRAANAIRSEAASTQDAVVLAGRVGGTSSFAVTLTPTTLTGNRTLTLPDAAGTIVHDGGSYGNPTWITSLAETKVLPSQATHSGKFLTTNGTSTSWSTVSGGINYTRVTSNTTLVDKQGVIADTSGGTFTVTLPATPTVGVQVSIVDGSNWASVNLTVARNGSTIENLAENLILDIGGAKVDLIYDGTTWEVYTQVGAGGSAATTGKAIAMAIVFGG